LNKNRIIIFHSSKADATAKFPKKYVCDMFMWFPDNLIVYSNYHKHDCSSHAAKERRRRSKKNAHPKLGSKKNIPTYK